MQSPGFNLLDGDVPRSTTNGVYISQLFRFAHVAGLVSDFNTRNNVLTAQLLRQGYRYYKILMAFSIFIGGILSKCLNKTSD